jgi:hypothetical protein
MIRIKSFKSLGYCYQVTVEINGETFVGDTYFDYDSHDKVKINGKTYEVIDFYYLKEV